MFGVDFSELMVILLVALLVIGPERLPKVARTLGFFWGRAQRYINGVKADIARDMAIDEFRQLTERVQQEARNAEQEVKNATQAIDQQVRQLNDTVERSVHTIAQPATALAEPVAAPTSAPAVQQHQLDLQAPATHPKFPVD